MVLGRTDWKLALPILEAEAGGGTLTRGLAYHQDLFGSLGGYTLPAGPVVEVKVAFYPIALATTAAISNLGIVGEAAHSVGLSSAIADGPSFPTNEDSWNLGLRWRFPFEPLELGASVRYGEQEFKLGEIPGNAAPPIPNYSYGFVEGRADLRLTLWRSLALMANAGYLLVVAHSIDETNTSTVTDYFPRASAGGLQAGAAIGWTFFDLLEPRLGADYQRFFYSFNSQPGDAYVAGGAIDQYLTLTLSLAVLLR